MSENDNNFEIIFFRVILIQGCGTFYLFAFHSSQKLLTKHRCPPCNYFIQGFYQKPLLIIQLLEKLK